MKKISMMLVCTLIVGGILMLTGCGSEDTASTNHGKSITASDAWYHYDEITGESEKMSFSEDKTFYWGCVCGEPIGDSDCYELYDYDNETSVITLYNNYDDMSMEIEVINSSDYHLLLKIDGKIKNYTYVETGLEIADSEKYLSGYSGEFSIIGGNAEEIELGPFDYDGDIEYPDNAVTAYEFADEAEAYTLYTYTHIKDGEVIREDVDYQQIPFSDAIENLEYGGYGFIWFNDDLQVEKILIYGDSIFEE